MTILQPIAPQGCGCDRRDILMTLISIDDALALIFARTTSVEETENLTLGLALGRTLASPVNALCMIPPFDNAAVDGFAIVTTELVGDGPWTLDIVARVQAGQSAKRPLCGLQSTRVFTGAPIPAGSDAVVMQEDVQRSGATI
jgi:molybdopterin molybdotransferase